MFTAVRPPPAQLAELEDFLGTVGFFDAGVGLVHPEKWHITLSFMPAVQTRQLEALHDALVRVASDTAPLELVLRHAGTFARSGTSTPIWMGVEGDLTHLARLASGCRTAGHRSGVRVDSPKHYRPHLTLSRHRPEKHGALWLERLDTFRGTPWTVTELVLVESVLGGHRQPARHGIIERHPLTG